MFLKNRFKSNEFLVLLFRFFALFLIYTSCRLAFYLFNTDLFPINTPQEFFRIFYGGLRFDLTALIYLNLLYFLLFLPPFPWKFNKIYRKILKGIFIILNTIGILANCIDIIYYRFILKRTTFGVFRDFKNETNMGKLFSQFVIEFWYITLLLIFFIIFLVFCYNLISVKQPVVKNKSKYYAKSTFLFLLTIYLSIVGMRSGFTRTTRPINMSNAGKYVSNPALMAIVQNTPFCIIRTCNKKSYKKVNFFKSDKELNSYFNPIKHYNNDSTFFKNKNVVVVILESFTRELVGSLNKDLDNGNYKGYTPFLDSLITKSLVFKKGYANGKKSIDAMPSILASIPSFMQPYISSEYSNNKINSLANILNNKGYYSAFFHGAPVGSMGFDSFANIAGFKNYYGKENYGNDNDFDGYWGISDDNFLQFMSRKLKEFPKPFMASVFTLSSHDPFKIPKGFENRFPIGKKPIHQCVGYTDYALKHFFESIENEPWYKNTIFVLTADHTSCPYYAEYKTKLNNFAVPIIFYTPDGSLKEMSNKIAQQLDIMPTVLAHLGYKNKFVSFGNNLLDKNDHNFAINYLYNNYQFTIDDYLIRFDGKNFTEAFNVIKDPWLKTSLNIDSIPLKYRKNFKAVIQQFNQRVLDNKMTAE